MSLDVSLHDPTATYDTEELYHANITHNLNLMANNAGIYDALWKPYRLLEGCSYTADRQEEEDFRQLNIDKVSADMITPTIEKGLDDMKKRPEYYKQFDSDNGWGIYDDFIPFIEKYLEALKTYPKAIVTTCI
tara:strand:+ start:896 stop:1294 length:399 start_codon:yes stop_codon:yes gene_type:complete